MTLRYESARDFVYQNGALWERALFACLFEGASRERAVACLAMHQNADGGWGHAIEHDIRTPESHAVAVEFALGVMAEFDLAATDVVARTAAWCEGNQVESGEFPLGESFHRYPRAPWWQEATSWPPDAITARLARLGAAPPRLRERAARWVDANLQVEELRGLDGESWRYRLYHYADYFSAIETAGAATWREAIAAKVVELARVQADGECALGWGWAAALPEGAVPADLVEKRLAALAAGQQEDGGWPDPHGLIQWRSLHTLWALKTLRARGRWRP